MNDFLQGKFNSATGYLHLHPSVNVISYSGDGCILQTESDEINLKVTGSDLTVEDSTWHPEFGNAVKSKKIKLQYSQSRVTYQITWKNL